MRRGAGSARDQGARVGQSPLDDIAGDHRIDQAEFMRFRGRDRLARKHHIQSAFEWNQPRQALGTACAGNDAQRQFRQAEPTALRGDPVMAGERKLGPRPQRGAMYGRDDWARLVLDCAKYFVESRLGNSAIELLYVSAGNKSVSRAANDNGCNLRLVFKLSKNPFQSGPHRLIHCVNRRIVDLDQGNIADPGTANDFAHLKPPGRGLGLMGCAEWTRAF